MVFKRILVMLICLISFSCFAQNVKQIPERVVTKHDEILFTKSEILEGQKIWESINGQQVGAVEKNGVYLTPDWTADWIHRQSVFMLNDFSHDKKHKKMHGKKHHKHDGQQYEDLPSAKQEKIQRKLVNEVHHAYYDAQTNTLHIKPKLAKAIEQVSFYYQDLFGNNVSFAEDRSQYSIRTNLVPNENDRRALAAFLFWNAWVRLSEQPDLSITYINDWPKEQVITNLGTTTYTLFAVLSALILVASAGLAAIWYLGLYPSLLAKFVKLKYEIEVFCKSKIPRQDG